MTLKKNFPILIIIFSFLYLFEKTDFIKNLINTHNINEEKRIENLYGFCSGESVGYLRHVNNKLNFQSNPKIINYEHTPQNLWSIYNSKYTNNKNNIFILLNYPGSEINLDLDKVSENFFEIKDTYFYSTLSSQIKYLYIDNQNLNKLKIDFYELNRNNNFKKIKTIKLIRNKNERYFSVNQELSQFNLNEKNLFIRLNEDNFSEIKLIFQNRFLIDQFKILNQYKNCYVIKK